MVEVETPTRRSVQNATFGPFFEFVSFLGGLGLGMAAAASPSDRKGATLTNRACQEEGIVTIPAGYGTVAL